MHKNSLLNDQTLPRIEPENNNKPSQTTMGYNSEVALEAYFSHALRTQPVGLPRWAE